MRTAILTGATSGLGRWIALGLAGAGCRLVLIGRDPNRLRDTGAWIAGRVPGAAPLTLTADLSLLSEVRRVAAEALVLAPAIDILINNAGLLSPRRVETAEGHELTLAVNHLGPFVLTRALLPALRAAPAGRVVTTGSSTSDRARIDPDDLELRRGWGMSRAYARSKLALLMTGLDTAERVAASGVTLNVVHPGLVASRLVRSGGIVQLAWRMMAPFSLTPEQGADTPLHAALSPELAGVTGRYLKRRVPAPPNRLALDPALRARVWAATERLAGPA